MHGGSRATQLAWLQDFPRSVYFDETNTNHPKINVLFELIPLSTTGTIGIDGRYRGVFCASGYNYPGSRRNRSKVDSFIFPELPPV